MSFFVSGGLSWSKCIAICTDGAKAMTGHVKGLIGLIRQPKAIRLSKALCREMGAAHEHLLLHTEVRWLSRGNVLSRVFDLKDELATFLADDPALVEPFVESSFLVRLAYLADIFEHLNILNQSLQGRQVTLVNAADQIRAFCSKL
ncbi:unnamed protein product [Ixodes persulcatus]